jgi:type IV pilus assembly protein PilN
MIRINLLGLERQKKARSFVFDPARQVTLACVAVFVLGAAGIGGWYWSLSRESAALDAQLVVAKQEVEQLRRVIAQVKTFETRRSQLLQRIDVIEQLRAGQRTPVRLLDHVSRSLPDMLWLTAMNQKNNELTIEGRSTTLIGISDFIGNLAGNTAVLQKPIELMNSQVENLTQQRNPTGVDVIKFSVKAKMTPLPKSPGAPDAPATAPGAAGKGAK